jgi:hypothetical protein
LLIYVGGVTVEILLLSAVYYFMPVGRLSAQHAGLPGRFVQGAVG